ncbi:cupin domain-containing protein [Motiliproteus sp. SC1-56]|uniref:cupin domain-containing protein n=1 Tax=Motiliproteus sp. SC1-56 TaxID=2799565 RepID=UPI001A8D3C96|nr:cupin domain-containing protein [Motiliproteus sp. SC1-56]
MRLNADFSEPVRVTPEDYRWVPSPVPGVERMMLDRIGEEVGRATSLVRYAPDSEFPGHTHVGGEEILVLKGAFADEHGRYPAGTYLRNPIGTSHRPRVGSEGAVIFVKLHQFHPADQAPCVIDTAAADWGLTPSDGIQQLLLHRFEGERVLLERWPAELFMPLDGDHGGRELLVLAGCLYDAQQAYPPGTWLRHPPGLPWSFFTRREGVQVYLKTGHLQQLL